MTIKNEFDEMEADLWFRAWTHFGDESDVVRLSDVFSDNIGPLHALVVDAFGGF